MEFSFAEGDGLVVEVETPGWVWSPTGSTRELIDSEPQGGKGREFSASSGACLSIPAAAANRPMSTLLVGNASVSRRVKRDEEPLVANCWTSFN